MIIPVEEFKEVGPERQGMSASKGIVTNASVASSPLGWSLTRGKVFRSVLAPKAAGPSAQELISFSLGQIGLKNHAGHKPAGRRGGQGSRT